MGLGTSFPYQLDVRMAPDGRSGTLLNQFEFIDPQHKVWITPKGATVDGASIPPPLWPVVGSPWVGKYREASVIHDYYCDTRIEPWQSVHKMFYDAMLANGVSELRARIMYAAVYRFGPRWNFLHTPRCKGCLSIPRRVSFYEPEPDLEEAKKLVQKIETQNLSLQQVQQEAEAGFQAAVKPLTLGRPTVKP
jgi:hypothetical protein